MAHRIAYVGGTVGRPGRGCVSQGFAPPRPCPPGPWPTPVDGADWVSGLTPGPPVRPTLNGEPVAGAIAASVADGWVDVVRVPDRSDGRYEPDVLGERMGAYRERFAGRVELVADAG